MRAPAHRGSEYQRSNRGDKRGEEGRSRGCLIIAVGKEHSNVPQRASGNHGLARVKDLLDVLLIGGGRDVNEHRGRLVDASPRLERAGDPSDCRSGVHVTSGSVWEPSRDVKRDLVHEELLVKQILLVQEQDQYRFGQPLGLHAGLEELKGLLQAVLALVLKQSLVVLGETSDKDGSRDVFEHVHPLASLGALTADVNDAVVGTVNIDILLNHSRRAGARTDAVFSGWDPVLSTPLGVSRSELVRKYVPAVLQVDGVLLGHSRLPEVLVVIEDVLQGLSSLLTQHGRSYANLVLEDLDRLGVLFVIQSVQNHNGAL